MEQKLVDYLVNRGLVGKKDMQRCVLRASMNKKSLVDEILDRLELEPRRLADSMGDYWGLEVWGQPSFEVDTPVLRSIAAKLAKKYGVLPVEKNEGERLFKLAVYDVEKARPVIEKLRDKTGVSPSLVLTPRDVLVAEVNRHYGNDSSANSKPERSQSQGAVIDKKSRRSRPERSTRSATGPGGSGIIERPTADDGGPTRQIDLATDNPFMDLIQQTADDGKGSKSGLEGTPTRDVVLEGEPEFFDDDEDITVDEPDVALRQVEAGGDGSAQIESALEEFSDHLEENDNRERLPVATSSSVNWGQFGDDEDRQSPLGGGARPDGRVFGPGEGGTTSEESGIFPVERDGFFDFDEAQAAEDLTLAQVVERQRRIIDKLEREIEYQKGILQTMAELLVEARVLSKRKLKSRLKAFKEEQRKRYED
jgi:hypothetical protein